MRFTRSRMSQIQSFRHLDQLNFARSLRRSKPFFWTVDLPGQILMTHWPF